MRSRCVYHWKPDIAALVNDQNRACSICALTEQKDKSTVFDAPMGRIVTAYATGKADAEDVREFYDDALPSLGWDKTGEGTFHRKAETLKIDVLGGQGGSPVNVSFTLSAESQPQ